MKSATKKYNFIIDNTSPETMEFARLVEYYQQLKGMLKGIDGLHLTEIKTGSLCNGLVAKTESSAIAFADRIGQIENRTASAGVTKCYEGLQDLLRDDVANARIDGLDGETILRFSPRPTKPEVVLVSDYGNFVGMLFGMEGKKSEKVTIKVNTEIYGDVKFVVSQADASAMTDKMFQRLRFHGWGKWGKGHDGQMILDGFKVDYYEQVKKVSLIDAVNEIRSLDLKWKDDPLKLIRDLKNDQVA